MSVVSDKDEFLTVSKARVTDIVFTFDGEDPENITRKRRRKTGVLSVHPESEEQVLQAALEEFRKRYPIEVYRDRQERIVRIRPSEI